MIPLTGGVRQAECPSQRTQKQESFLKDGQRRIPLILVKQKKGYRRCFVTREPAVDHREVSFGMQTLAARARAVPFVSLFMGMGLAWNPGGLTRVSLGSSNQLLFRESSRSFRAFARPNTSFRKGARSLASSSSVCAPHKSNGPNGHVHLTL
jgi:hypothetical protein